MLTDFGYSATLNQKFELYLHPLPSSSTFIPTDGSDSPPHPTSLLHELSDGDDDVISKISKVETTSSSRSPMEVSLSVQVLSTGNCNT